MGGLNHNSTFQVRLQENLLTKGLREQILAPYVGCRRVVFFPKRRHYVSCRRHVADMFQSCRRHKKMLCRLECLNDTTFDDMSGNSRHVGNFSIVV